MSLYKELVHKLEKLFGHFDSEHKRFGNANNSIISRELGYSDSQFSRLINESATEGEYQRALLNVDRILKVKKLEAQLEKNPGKSSFTNKSLFIIFLTGFLAIVILLVIFLPKLLSEESNMVNVSRAHTLEWTFESSFINPYAKLDDLPDDCNYPCYKYQGKWELEHSYKLPFFRERNGFHYLATEVNMFARCLVEKSDRGDIIEGYEYQKHEIWYDKREWPIDSFITSGTTPSKFYQELDFTQVSDFVKVATVHTFFRNEFNLSDSTINRTGKVIGRDLELVTRDELKESIKDDRKLDGIAIEMSRIISNRLKDFSVPIRCTDSPLINKDVTQIKDGDVMSFDCQLTTSGFSIDYNKTFVLMDQYIKNNCIPE